MNGILLEVWDWFSIPLDSHDTNLAYPRMERAVLSRGGKVRRNDAPYTHFLRSAKEVLLLIDHSRRRSAYEDVDASKVSFVRVEVVREVSYADFHPCGAHDFDARLLNRARSNQNSDTLVIIAHV